jgi:hypothetical protein
MNVPMKIDLVEWRATWAARELEELRITKLADDILTTEQNANLYLNLCALAEPQFRATEPIFRSERMEYLAELQARLQRFGNWWERQHGSIAHTL